ncbi:MAG: HXXEE domain-containing protein, partial [Leptospiraceae bacterium]|nr:HXXEE domain-containing protein [Leptospiraceae bacterium]
NPRIKSAVYALPLVFILHNLEELIGMASWTEQIPAAIHPHVTTLQFAIAITLFSLLGLVTVFGSPRLINSVWHERILIVFAGMLWLNVFLPHVLATIVFQMYAPGVFTAVLLNLPLTSFILWSMYRNGRHSVMSLFLLIASGGAIGAGLAVIFLRIGGWAASFFWTGACVESLLAVV